MTAEKFTRQHLGKRVRYRNAWLIPGTFVSAMVEQLEVLADALPSVVDDRYPHACPRCKGPAYIGALELDCKAGCR